MNDISESRFCKTHAPKVVGKDQWGNFYDICYAGKREEMRGEKTTCEIVVVKYDARREVKNE